MKNIKLKYINKRLTACLVAGTLLLTGCGSSKKNNETDDHSNIAIPVVTNDIMGENTTSSAITYEDFNEIMGVQIDSKLNLNSDDATTALTILNIDYIIVNHPEVLSELYPKGLNSDKELKDFQTFFSKYREYNTEIDSTSEFLRLSIYAKDEEDKTIIEKLENLTIEYINLVNSNGDTNRIKEIFETFVNFYNRKDIVIDGMTINKDDLSNGFNMGSELFGQIISVQSDDLDEKKDRPAIITMEQRKQLDKILNNSDSRSKVIVLIENFANNSKNIIASYIDDIVTYELSEEDKILIQTFESRCNKVKQDLTQKGINLSDSQINSLVFIRNIDYLASDNVSTSAFKTIVNDREPLDILNEVTFAINSIEAYNTSRSNMNELYLYEMAINQDEEEIENDIAICGALSNTFGLRNSVGTASEKEVLNNNYYLSIKFYNNYSSENGVINFNGMTVAKNNTGYGTRYITDAIYFNSLSKLSYQNEDINRLVNNTDRGMSSIDTISQAIDGKCSTYEFVR